MAARWSLLDLTAFDLLLRKGVPNRASVQEVSSDPSRNPLQHWLDGTRQSDPQVHHLATQALRSEHWFRAAYWFFSWLAGISAASLLLRYEGDRLINISAFLGLLIGGQLLSLLITGLLQYGLRRPRGLHKWLLPRLHQESPLLYSLPAWRWRVFTDVQIGGVVFNLGVCISTLWKVLTRDLAFGWATTLQVNGAQMHRLVQTLALPWGGWATPDPQQIDQSRIVLKEGLARIDAASTASWWPFLLLCILFYGALPRLVLAFAGAVRQRHCLRQPPFHHPGAQRLIRLLTREPLQFASDTDPETTAPKPPNGALPALAPQGALELRFAEPLLSTEQKDRWQDALAARWGLTFSSADSAVGVLWVVEAWQPPLQQTQRELQMLRQEMGPNRDLLVLLVGEPLAEPDGFFSAPKQEDVDLWQAHLLRLQDPGLGMLVWSPSP